MKFNALFAAMLFALTPLPAAAQAFFGNPFSDAATYRSARGALDEARYRVRYDATITEHGGQPVVGEITFDVADDWALVREGDRTTLYDFQLNRVFTIDADSFRGQNAMGNLTFRIMERQNRAYLTQIAQSAGVQANQLPDACDAETELSVVVPGARAGATSFREQRGVFTFTCDDREMGGFTMGEGAAPPRAFWPAMYAEMGTHPALHHRVRETGHAPAQLSTSFRSGAAQPAQRAWRLIAVENVSTPYPLVENLRNVSADALNQLVPGTGQIGVDAVAGRAQGGAPTLQSWDAHLRDISRREGEAAAAMLMAPSFNMFPELQCNSGPRYAICEIAQRLRSIRDPAPMAILEVGMAEQSHNNAAAIAAMTRAQSSPLRDHPALGAAFALAALRFNDAERAQATAAHLPLDIAALQNRALLAYPYNPAYWTDVGDRYGANYEWPSAFMFYDVAYSLPMPSALSGNQSLIARRTQMERIRRDFPEAFLATTP
ncbi:MAG: hypothetical protein R3C31_06545 [Hyphomonadaceae bacterium]